MVNAPPTPNRPSPISHLHHSLSLPIAAPQLWDVDAPHLHTLRATLHERSVPLDVVTRTFGFRTIEARDGHLWLNGRPLYLRGALDQDYYPDLICTPPSRDDIEDQFRQAKAMGLNCLRVHIKVADPRYCEAADRMGLLIWTELPNWSLLTDDARRRARETLAGMVARDGHHPSVIVWTIINESGGADLTDAEQRAWLAEMVAYLKALDPHRLVVDNSACWGNFHVVTDIEDFHNYHAMPDHYIQWRGWVARFAGRPWWSFAHAYSDYAAWRTFSRDPWNAPPQPPAPEVRRRGDEPLIVSEFGNWGLPEVDRLIEGYGGQEPWWFETGHEWGDGVVYPRGIEARFRTFHLDRAFPTLADLAAASQRLQVAALKYEIEQLRRHASLQGYVITEFTDVHWECNGLLDILRRPKAIAAALPQFNADDVIVPEWERLAYWEGERCEVAVLLSHYSTRTLRGARLEWQLDDWPDVRGGWIDLAPRRAGLTEIGRIAFDVPAVHAGRRARLALRLIDADGMLAASTYQELVFFPRWSASNASDLRLYAPALRAPLRALGYRVTESLAEAHLAVALTLTDAVREYLLQGGRVLWLAETDDARQTCLGGVQLVPRRGTPWQGDWASSFSWLYQDRLFAAIPAEGVVDFAFAGLTPDHVLTGFTPHAFAADVHAGLFVGWLHKTVALIAERRLGRGRLLASTFRLSQHIATHPVAALMVRDMLSHLSR